MLSVHAAVNHKMYFEVDFQVSWLCIFFNIFTRRPIRPLWWHALGVSIVESLVQAKETLIFFMMFQVGMGDYLIKTVKYRINVVKFQSVVG